MIKNADTKKEKCKKRLLEENCTTTLLCSALCDIFEKVRQKVYSSWEPTSSSLRGEPGHLLKLWNTIDIDEI